MFYMSARTFSVFYSNTLLDANDPQTNKQTNLWESIQA